MDSLVMLIVVVLAVFRVNRLWQDDLILEPLRARLFGPVEFVESGDGELDEARQWHLGWLSGKGHAFTDWVTDLLTCQWCLGMWLSFAAVLSGVAVDAFDGITVAWTPAGVWWALALSLAVASGQSLVYRLGE